MRKIFSSLVIFSLAFFVLATSQVSAKVLSSEKGEVNILKGEVVNDDLFIGAQGATIDGTVNGDVYIGAQNVKVDGAISGNLYIGAQSVYLGGPVKGSVYIGAQNVSIVGSSINGSLLIGAQSVTIDKDTIVGGSVLTGSAMLTLDSQVKRNVFAGTGSLNIGSDAKIAKDLYYAAGQRGSSVNISKDAKISGEIHKSEIKTTQKNVDVEAARKNFSAFANSAKVVTTIISFAGALIVGFLYSKFSGKHFSQVTDIVAKSFWKSFGVGFLVTIAAIPGLIILAITVVGIPIAGLAVLILLMYVYLAKIVVGSALGNWFVKRFNWKVSAYGSFAIGLLVIYILKLIPIIGFLSGIVVLWAGLGALALRLFSKAE